MKAWPTTSMGDTSSMLKLARFFTERFIMDSAMRMKARGMGSFCSSVSSTIRSFSLENGLSTICAHHSRIFYELIRTAWLCVSEVSRVQNYTF